MLPSRDSFPQFGTQNSFGTPGNVFENPLARNEPTAYCSRYVYASSLTATHCELVSLYTGRSIAKKKELERHVQNFALPTPRYARKFSTWNPPSHAERADRQNCMVEQPRNQVSDVHFHSVGKRASRPRYVLVQTFPRKQCSGPKKWRWSFGGRSSDVAVNSTKSFA